MELFKELGAEIEQLWREANYDETVFHQIVADALEAADLRSLKSRTPRKNCNA